MNRFLTRRKDKALDDGDSGKKSKKGKKGQPEPKPQLDLTMALPATDNFRTSLIMPSLSTRFSMLREQDDPSSKIGKASDDSVLQPKRQSRLHEFGFIPGGLSDIAEVQSINGSIRPPFATERTNSFDSHNTDDGSGNVMTRSRPGEGNILFGGRQKIYKIGNSGLPRNGGRMLYEDDVNLSTFQKMRLQEKERLKELEAEEANGQQLESSSPPKDVAYSPSVESYSRRRETSSSTNSGTVDTRTSTAATSIASQGGGSVSASSPALPSNAAPVSPVELNRTTTKVRRLYDQGLDQHLYDQQNSAMNRLNSIQRTRAPTGRSTPPIPYSQTRSATNLNDRFNRGPVFRTESPTALNNPGIFSATDTQSGGSSPVVSRPQSPPLVSPLTSDGEDSQTLSLALQPNDRGKATAMGAFNKPKQAFSEQQYAERMKRMQQERDASVPKLENPRKPSLRERAEQERRRRAETAMPERHPSESSIEQTQSPSGFSIFQSAAHQMRSPPTTASSPLKQPEPSPQDIRSPDSQKGATFFTSPVSSDDEQELRQPTTAKLSELGRRPENLPTATGPAPPILDHPALRSRSNSRPEGNFEHPALRSRSNSRPEGTFEHPALRSRSNSRPAPPPQNAARSSPPAVPAPNDPDIDSPTLGPDSGGLSGLIRQHLRNVSNVSSDYGDNQSTMSPPPASTAPLSLRSHDGGFQRRQPPARSEADTPAHSTYSHSNPWDLDDIDNPFQGERDSMSSTSPVDASKTRSPSNAITAPSNDVPHWEKEMRKTHQRGASNETQDEREAFQRDMAQRQRAIQESLRANAEGRSTSPAPTSSGGGFKTALNLLRAKSSRESFAVVGQTEAQNKAMKMLGLGGSSANASSTSLSGSQFGEQRISEEERYGKSGPKLRQKPSRVLQQSEQDAQRELVNRQRSGTEDSIRNPRSNGRTPPTSNRSSTRDRSSSDVSSGRSRSRPGQYRDDLEQAMMEGTSSRSTVYPPNNTPSLAGYVANPTQPLPADQPSMDSQGRLRSRSNSRTAAAGHFESKHLQPIHTGNGPMNGTSPRLPHSPGLPISPRPSPGGPSPSVSSFRPQASPVPPFSANNTPPVSNPSTPLAPGFHANAAAQPAMRTGPLRKKSVAKSEIGEPVFLSTTSVIDTIDLPAGASLRNGVDLSLPPPVPPINPMRRRFLGRQENHDPAIHRGLGSPKSPFADPTRTNSSDALSSQTKLPRPGLRKISSEGKSLHGKAQAQTGNSPPMPPTPTMGRNGSPPRPINHHPAPQRPMDGAMF
ncbi:hypothetical protein BDV95DRAFT_242708 [Massariosphaeria phaeospora]|uniref:Uncharacterized protein n=1 Tax=Massariosphaeria phaeospora TaxID=100035 RepID=A0A7C8I5V4_9PLEO|nr:hypothetical protein BDV95DRAFT_242708 [Massariosphaeria phaeospora]